MVHTLDERNNVAWVQLFCMTYFCPRAWLNVRPDLVEPDGSAVEVTRMGILTCREEVNYDDTSCAYSTVSDVKDYSENAKIPNEIMYISTIHNMQSCQCMSILLDDRNDWRCELTDRLTC